jgi:uncharacterized protein (DUF362 family)
MADGRACPRLGRRALLGAAFAATGAATLRSDEAAAALRAASSSAWAARPRAGFVRLARAGHVAKVHKTGSLQANGVHPEPTAARLMLEHALTELTGASSLRDALATLIHPGDRVAIKPNGIAGKRTMKMAANKEVIVELVRGLLAAGVAPEQITIYEQYRDFLFATRCITDRLSLALAPELPAGVKAAVHLNEDAVMGPILVDGIATRYVRPFTDATAVINVCQVKDHSICGYTGAMKNITHGSNVNPHDFHEHNASPQIAHLYAQDVVRSRVALHIADAYQVIYDEGPMDRNPRRRVPHEALYAATDPVAIDVVGWEVVERLRRDNGLPTLAQARREPSYLRVAGNLGLGVFDRQRIRLSEVTL